MNVSRFIYLYKLNSFAVRTILYKFSARNTNMFALFGLSCTRFAVTICPALLKSLSVGALLAGMARYRRAYWDRRGKSFSWNFHPWSELSSPSIVGNCKYRANSLAAQSW